MTLDAIVHVDGSKHGLRETCATCKANARETRVADLIAELRALIEHAPPGEREVLIDAIRRELL